MSTASISRFKRKRGLSALRKQEEKMGYLLASPWIIGFALFVLGPMVASFFLSFSHYDVTFIFKWIGFKNYVNMFTQDTLFWKSMFNTVYYTLFAVPLGIIGGMAIAMLLNQKLKGITVFRTIFYLPSVTSGVAVAMLWLWLLDPSIGLVNIVLRWFWIKGPLWLQSPGWSKPALILMSLWGLGGGMIIYLAGLQGIPRQLYEAAELDGAGLWSRFWHITLPMMTPVLLFNLIMGIISSFQVFTQAYVMTGGGPLNSTLFYVYHLYMQAFQAFRMGYGCALAWFLFLIILSLSLLVFKTSASWVYYEGSLEGR